MNKYHTPSSQRGATLLVVMMMLIVLTVVGVLAIRVAMTSLNISTNTQLGQFLSQTADTPINQLYTGNLSNLVDLSGVVGYALQDSKLEPGHEYIFCYKPLSNEKFGASLGVAVKRPPANKIDKATLLSGGSDAFCDLSSDFGSSREAVVTQVAVKIPNEAEEDLKPGALLSRGNNLSSGTIMPKNVVEQQRIRVTTTSVVPSFAKNLDAAQDCIGTGSGNPGYISDDTSSDTKGFETIATCLAKLGVPVNSQIQEFNLQTIFSQTQAP
ncbi:pilus assembly PilX family protein [Acinetobacter sp.]|uniref:pilus assembly PilX family protein n=1 Tax=Acinetobacter sp. TaxID=472 RepID=UPI003D0165FD